MSPETKRSRSTKRLCCRARHSSASQLALLLALISVPGHPTSVEALQQKPPQTAGEKDSLKALNRAVQSLRQYERQLDLLAEQGARVRRGGYSGGITGVCELSIANYCYGPRNGFLVYGGLGTVPASGRFGPSVYPRMYQKRFNWAVSSYRDSLLKILRIIPRDRWIYGELVRFPLERANYIGAMDNLKNCPLEDWYCNALRAYVIQIAGVLPRADSLWNKVVPMMPAIERCAWLDPSWVSSDNSIAEQIREMSCAARERIANRVWWLSDPLWSRDGNERVRSTSPAMLNCSLWLARPHRRI